ncbi:hypothetical protein ACLB2K_029995 [Fragaria x ananassa]
MAEEQDSSISPSISTIVSTEAEGNPNLHLTSVLLNEFNYLSWSRAISLALGGKSKLRHINGSVLPPEQLTLTYEQHVQHDPSTWLKVCPSILVASSVEVISDMGYIPHQHVQHAPSTWLKVCPSIPVASSVEVI